MKMYLVFRQINEYADAWIENIFVTSDEEKAKNYVEKHNNLLDKAMLIYEKESYRKINEKRYWRVYDIHKCEYEEIETR